MTPLRFGKRAHSLDDERAHHVVPVVVSSTSTTSRGGRSVVSISSGGRSVLGALGPGLRSGTTRIRVLDELTLPPAARPLIAELKALYQPLHTPVQGSVNAQETKLVSTLSSGGPRWAEARDGSPVEMPADLVRAL